jgi:hypothetical protein
MQADSTRRCAFAPLLGTMLMLLHHQNRMNQRRKFALALGGRGTVRADAGRFDAPLCICTIAWDHADAVAPSESPESTSQFCG